MRAVALAAVAALVVAAGAEAKFSLSLRVAPETPNARQPVRVLIRAGEPQAAGCRMRLVAVAPGADLNKALEVLINGEPTTGPSRRLGFRVRTHRVDPSTWRARLAFPRRGRWRLAVPNWCAPGVASPPPKVRVVLVRRAA